MKQWILYFCIITLCSLTLGYANSTSVPNPTFSKTTNDTLKLTITAESSGTTVPFPGIFNLSPGDTFSVEARPFNNTLKLKEWVVTSGSAIIVDPFTPKTQIILTDGDATVEAQFTLKTYTFTLHYDTTLGFIDVRPKKEYYEHDDTITLTQSAKDSCYFKEWQNLGLINSNTTRQFIISHDTTVTGVFKRYSTTIDSFSISTSKTFVGKDVNLFTKITTDIGSKDTTYYDWYHNDRLLSTTTFFSWYTFKTDKNSSGNYYCIIRNLSGHHVTDTFSLEVTDFLTIDDSSLKDDTCWLLAQNNNDSYFNLKFNASGGIDPEFQWYRKNPQKSFEKIATTQEPTIDIPIALDAEGVYYCKAVDKSDPDRELKTSEFYITVNVQAIINPASLSDTTIKKGGSLTLEAEIYDDPPPTKPIRYIWSYTKLGSSQSIELQNSTKNSYTVNDMSPDKEGVYQCKVDNGAPYGSFQTMRLFLDVGQVTITEPESDITIDRFENDSTFNQQVKYLGDVDSLRWEYRKDSTSSWKKHNLVNDFLSFNKLTENDEGQYRLLIYPLKSKTPQLSKIITLIVREKAAFVHKTAPLLERQEGETLTLNATLRTGHDDNPIFTWFCNNTIVQSGPSNSFPIDSLTKKDAGSYTCHVTNVLKSDSSIIGFDETTIATVQLYGKAQFNGQLPKVRYMWTGKNNTVSIHTQALGTKLHYEWYKKINDSIIKLPTDPQDNILTVKLPHNSQKVSYRCFVSNTFNNKVHRDSTSWCQVIPKKSPHITKFLPDTTKIYYGQSIKLSIGAVVDPSRILRYKWFKNGKEIFLSTTETLRLHSAEVKHNGNYTCVVFADSLEDIDTHMTRDSTKTVLTVVPPPIEITSPNNGDVLTIGKKHTIKWKLHNSNIKRINIYFSTEGNTENTQWKRIARNIDAGDNSYSWSVSSSEQSNKCKIKISEVSYSKEPFSITNDGYFTVIPNIAIKKSLVQNNNTILKAFPNIVTMSNKKDVNFLFTPQETIQRGSIKIFTPTGSLVYSNNINDLYKCKQGSSYIISQWNTLNQDNKDLHPGQYLVSFSYISSNGETKTSLIPIAIKK